MSSRPSRWRLVFSNGDVETINELVYLRLSVDGHRLMVESPSSTREIIRTFNMRHVRSWEPVG